MAIVSSKLPYYEIYQLKLTLRWCCKGGDQRGYGDTPEEAYNEWVYLNRYNSCGGNW